jgi:hypothetical protein
MPSFPRLCSTHHVAIWRRNVSNFSNLVNPWKTLCQESEISLEINGGAGLIEFRSGSPISPYIYTGFRATVQFIHTGLLSSTVTDSSSSSLSFQDNDGNGGINHHDLNSSGGKSGHHHHQQHHFPRNHEKIRRPYGGSGPATPGGSSGVLATRRTFAPPYYNKAYDDGGDEEEEDGSEEDDSSYPRSTYGYGKYFYLKARLNHLMDIT